MIPAHSTTKGEQSTQLTPLAWTQDLPPPSSHMWDQLPHSLEPAREHVTCFCSLMSPNKAFFPPEFVSGLLPTSIDRVQEPWSVTQEDFC